MSGSGFRVQGSGLGFGVEGSGCGFEGEVPVQMIYLVKRDGPVLELHEGGEGVVRVDAVAETNQVLLGVDSLP